MSEGSKFYEAVELLRDMVTACDQSERADVGHVHGYELDKARKFLNQWDSRPDMTYAEWVSQGRPHWKCMGCGSILITIPQNRDFLCPTCKMAKQ